jgi:hypothetical protein
MASFPIYEIISEIIVKQEKSCIYIKRLKDTVKYVSGIKVTEGGRPHHKIRKSRTTNNSFSVYYFKVVFILVSLFYVNNDVNFVFGEMAY